MELPVPAIWVDGEPATALPLPDRGLDFGDGLFETLLLRSGTPLFPDMHFERLAEGLRRLSFPDCVPRARIFLERACEALGGWPWAALRMTVTRGSAPRGYAPPAQAIPRLVIAAAPLAQDPCILPPALQLHLAGIRYAIQPALAGIKHLNRLEQVMAAAEAAAAGVDDAVMLGTQGAVCSLASANLFMVEGGRLVTPRLEACGIHGTRRRLVCERWAPAAGLFVSEGEIPLARLLAADEVFCSNSLRGLQPVTGFLDRRWEHFPVCTALHAQYVNSMPC